jgi:hypothetical protein
MNRLKLMQTDPCESIESGKVKTFSVPPINSVNPVIKYEISRSDFNLYSVSVFAIKF